MNHAWSSRRDCRNEHGIPDEKKDARPADPSFEEAVKRLSDIVQRLERGDLPLGRVARAVRRRRRIIEDFAGKLDNAQKRVEAPQRRPRRQAGDEVVRDAR